MGMGKCVSICSWCKGKEWREVFKSQKSLISGRQCYSFHMSINLLHSSVSQSAPSKAGSSWTGSASAHHRLNPNSVFPSEFMSCLWLVAGSCTVFTDLKAWIFFSEGFFTGAALQAVRGPGSPMLCSASYSTMPARKAPEFWALR